MLGANGPPFMALFTVLPCHKHEIRASVCFVGIFVVPLRIYLAVTNSLLHVDEWTTYVAVTIVSLIGTWFGDRAMTYFNTKLILLGVISLLFVSAVSEMDFLGVAATPFLIVVIIVVLGLWVAYLGRCRRAFQ
jgi:uncharacterized membrane protein YfcA